MKQSQGTPLGSVAALEAIQNLRFPCFVSGIANYFTTDSVLKAWATQDCAKLNSDGKLQTSQMPTAIPAQWKKDLLGEQWVMMMNGRDDKDEYQYPLVGQLDGSTFVPASSYVLIHNGYFPDNDATYPYWLHGCKLSYEQAVRVMASSWSPVLHGALPQARTHKVMPLYQGEDVGALSMGLASCLGGSQLWAVDLVGKFGNMFYNNTNGIPSQTTVPSVMPSDLYRAFDTNTMLVSINGAIDMRFLNDSKILRAFYGCTNLRFLRLHSIPDAVTTIDFTGCKRLWPHLFLQMTFYNSVTKEQQKTRPSTTTVPLTIKLDSELWNAYSSMNANIWKSVYPTYTFSEWIASLTARRIQFVVNGEIMNV